MDEVSCRVLDPFLRALRARGIDREVLFRGTAVSRARVRGRNARLDWDVYRRVMANVATLFTDEQLVDIGGSFLRSPLARSFTPIMRLLFSVRECYAWGYSPSGPGRQAFTCIVAGTEEIGPGRMRIRFTMEPGYAPCREVFLVSLGAMIDLPRVVGLPPAEVRMQLVPDGAVYDLEYPCGGGTLAFVRRAVAWPLAARTVARELKDAHEALLERYHQLEHARAQLQHQATQLETAHSISQVIHRHLDLDRTLDAVVDALTRVAGFAAAHVRIEGTMDDTEVLRTVGTGEPPPSGRRFTRSIESHGVAIGEVRLWPAPGIDDAECERLVAYLMPVLSMAIGDALTFTVLSDYRNNLETRVAARTAELEQAHDQLAQTVARLQEAQAARERIFANINHELRTPLSVITTAVGAVSRREQGLDERSVSELAAVTESAGRLLALVDNLLLLAAGGEGRLKLNRTDLDVAEAWRGYVATWAPVAAELGLALNCHAPPSLRASVDESALARIAGNLLSNAVKFTPAGGRIDVDVIERDGGVEIVVQDTGIGIDARLRGRIFERFEQGRPAPRPDSAGSGIGLSIVKELVSAHDGSITVESCSPGTLFRVLLPSPASGAGEPDTGGSAVSAPDMGRLARELRPQDEDTAVLEPVSGGDVTLLVAEDDAHLRQLVATVLSERFRVLVAADGESALRLAERYRPHVLISDVGMPGMNGFELTRRFRALPGNRLAPVILVTAWGALRDRLSGFDAGAVDYVVKPFAVEELEARVTSQLAMRDMALRLHETEKLASLGVLAAGLAHEIRNPANAALNAVPALEAALPADSVRAGTTARALLDVIEEAAGRIAALARDLLGLARPGASSDTRESVAALVKRARAAVAQRVAGVEVREVLEYTGAIPCEPSLVLQVLINLLENATDAAGPGGWVRLRVSRDVDAVIVDVSDSGPGVPVEVRERVFDPFYTTKPPGAGTGLGLTISRIVAQRHGGTLDVVDLPGARTAFRLRLPLEALERGRETAVGSVVREDVLV